MSCEPPKFVLKKANKMKKVILTGDRPTGKLHIGHYVGSLENRIKLQDDNKQYILIADTQALTDNQGNINKVTSNILEVMKDYLAVGLDPNKTTFCLQSKIPELFELTSYYQNLVSVSRVGRNPTVKHESGRLKFLSLGFFSYPVSQAADITAFKADLVPVGRDQLPMIEIANEIVRKFNSTYSEVLVECKPLISNFSRLPGIDGKEKMSKSMNNAIFLGDSKELVSKKIKKMFTDPNHLRVEDPGTVKGNPVFTYLDAFCNDKSLVSGLKSHYEKGGLGDGEVKRILNQHLEQFLLPIRERRNALSGKGNFLKEILFDGTNKARQIVSNTLSGVKQSMGMFDF